VGLYLCIYEGDDDIDGVEVGPYSFVSSKAGALAAGFRPSSSTVIVMASGPSQSVGSCASS